MPGISEAFGGFSGAKGRWLMIAAVVTMGGYFLKTSNLLSTNHSRPSSTESGRVVSSNWRENSRKKIEVEERGRTWGDAAVRFGLSFGIAMIAGSLLRVFLKTMITLFVIAAVVLFLLYHQGLVEPFWQDYPAAAGDAKDWAVAHKESVQQFLKGYVPSAGAALIGFGFGLRK